MPSADTVTDCRSFSVTPRQSVVVQSESIALWASARCVRCMLTADSLPKVVGGTVTLEGNCGSHWEQVVAEDVTRSVRGVKDVNNLLLVNLVEKISDEELSNAIQAALGRARVLRDTSVNVAIVDKAAILSGEVSSLDQKLAAEMVIWRFGLLHIRNDIMVTN